MTEKGYLASLEMTTKFLNNCQYVITYEKQDGTEGKTFVKEKDLDWNLNKYLPQIGYAVLAVEKIISAEIPAMAKEITDNLAKRRYNYIHI
jgi:hypothetical protein